MASSLCSSAAKPRTHSFPDYYARVYTVNAVCSWAPCTKSPSLSVTIESEVRDQKNVLCAEWTCQFVEPQHSPSHVDVFLRTEFSSGTESFPSSGVLYGDLLNSLALVCGQRLQSGTHCLEQFRVILLVRHSFEELNDIWEGESA